MENAISAKIIGAAIEVHRTLGGPGLLESIYEKALCHELNFLKLTCKRQVIVPVSYKGITISDPLFIDILVEDLVVIEVKASEDDHLVHKSQLLTYLRLTNLKLGILLNFGKKQMKEGIHRVVNKL